MLRNIRRLNSVYGLVQLLSLTIYLTEFALTWGGMLQSL